MVNFLILKPLPNQLKSTQCESKIGQRLGTDSSQKRMCS